MLPDINLTHLRYFYDSVNLGSLSSAARENFVSQSAISQGIARLEQALQVNLSTHQRQAFRLTEEGHAVYDEAKRIFGAVEGLKDRLRNLKGEISGDVKFACTNAIAQFYLPLYYLQMRESYPLVRLKFHRGSLHFLHDALKEEKVSFALALDAPEFYGYEKRVLYKGSFRLYRAKKAKTSPGIFIDHYENPEVLQLRKSYKEHSGKELLIQAALSGWGLVATFVQMGCGTGFLPDFIFRGNSNVKEVPLKIPPIEYTISALWLKGSHLTRACHAFLDILKEKGD